MIKTLLILLISLWLLNSCQNNVYAPNTFIVIRYNSFLSDSYTDIAKVNFYKETQNAIVYLEIGYQIDTEKLDFMMEGFEENYSQMTNTYGKPTDIDNNGKIIILLVNMNGMVRGVFVDEDLIYGRGNNAEILYLDIKLFNDYPSFQDTLLHEFQHLINHNVNFIQKGYSILWLNETLSQSTQSFLYTGYYWWDELFTPLQYYCFYTWHLERYYGDDYRINYSSAEEFIWYLFEKNNKNPEVFKRIAHSSEREGYKRILSAVSDMGIGNTWEEVLYNFAKFILDKARYVNFFPSNTTVPLYPGAFIFYKENGEYKIALNPDTYIGNSPKPIYFTTP